MIGSGIHDVEKLEITKVRQLYPEKDGACWVRDLNIRFLNTKELFQITLYADSKHKLKILKRELI